MIRVFGHQDPSVMDDDTWAQWVNDIEFCLKYQNDLLANTVVKILAPLMKY